MIFYGLAAVYYRSSLQKCVSLRSAEAEYVASPESTKAVLGLQGILNELGKIQQTTSIMQEYYMSVKWGTGHPAKDSERSKHIELRYH